MRCSLFYNFDVLPEQFVPSLYCLIETQIVRADQLGFETAWIAEHHFGLYGRMASPLLFLSRLSALTERIGLGTAVVEAPHYHPLRLAEEAILLDVLSNGRLRLGIGSGAKNKPEEFAAFGVPLGEKTARTREVVAILEQAFRTGQVSFTGRHYQFENVILNPLPLQSPDHLIWIAASASTAEWAGAQGYPLLVPRVGSPNDHRQWIARYRAASGRPGGNVAQLRFVFVAETEREAREKTRAAFARYAHYDCDVNWDGRTDTREYHDLAQRMNMLIGTPAQIREQLTVWQADYGFDEIICQTFAAGIRHEDALRSIELLGCEVLPPLQQTPEEKRRRRAGRRSFP
jgi:alkanesulfonate monooxygenase SsuD/methylene tetrahydromethanopterin reductase-like flavin-dependent oxidoreductase (luciferase family)